MSDVTTTLTIEELHAAELATQSLGAISDRIADYRATAANTTARLNAYYEQEYGIPNFCQSLADWWGQPGPGVEFVMARQIPTWSVESLSLHLLADWCSRNGLPAQAAPVSFTRDCYGRHGYKESLIKARVVRQCGEKVMVRGVPLLPIGVQLAPPPILRHLNTTERGYLFGEKASGEVLTSFHERFRRRALTAAGETNGHLRDVSPWFEQSLRASLGSTAPKRPEYLFVQDGRTDRRVSVRELDNRPGLLERSLRPNALWYYTLYLSMFVTGERVLVASLDEDESVHEMFAAFADVEAICGRKPLIVWVPYTSGEAVTTNGETVLFNEVNPATLEDGWRSKIGDPPMGSTAYDAMKYFELAVLRLQ